MLTPELVWKLRKHAYDVPVRFIQLLERLNVTPRENKHFKKHEHKDHKDRSSFASKDKNGWTTIKDPKKRFIKAEEMTFRKSLDDFSKKAGVDTPNSKEDVPKVVTSILNKLAPVNYNDLKPCMISIFEEFPDDVITTQKVADELFKVGISSQDIYAKLYAQLIVDMDNQLMNTIIYRKYGEFLKGFSVVFPFVDPHNKHMEIENEEDREEAIGKDYEEFCRQNRERSRRRGFARWIAHLYTVNILQEKDVINTSKGLFELIHRDMKAEANIDQVNEYAQSVMGLIKLLKGTSIEAFLKAEVKKVLEVPKVEAPGINMKTKFVFEDIMEI
jgi:hypothetical protein